MIMKSPFDYAYLAHRASAPARAPSPRPPPATGVDGTGRRAVKLGGQSRAVMVGGTERRAPAPLASARIAGGPSLKLTALLCLLSAISDGKRSLTDAAAEFVWAAPDDRKCEPRADRKSVV